LLRITDVDLSRFEQDSYVDQILLNSLLQPRRFDNKVPSIFRCPRQRLLSRLVLFPPLCPRLFTFVLALYASYTFPLIATVTTQFVVANAVVDICERYVCRLMPLVLAVESRQGNGVVYIQIRCFYGRWGIWGQVGTCRGARFIRSIGAIAVVVVYLGWLKSDRRVEDAAEGGFLVEFCDYT